MANTASAFSTASGVLSDLISSNRILVNQAHTSKKKVLDCLAEILYNDLNCDKEAFSHSRLQDAFVAREKLGSTALEHGVAIPHCRINACGKPMIALITLNKAIDFEADNGMEVDLICGLIVPEEADQQHLDILAALVQLLGIDRNRDAIRGAESPAEVFELLKNTPLK